MTASLRVWRERLFAGPVSSVVTALIVAAIVAIGWPLLRWAVLDATFSGATRNDCTGGGACWVFVRARFGQFMYGLYPIDQRWRIDLFAVIALVWVALLFVRSLPYRAWVGLGALVILPPLGVWLLGGGFGLQPVETRQWGGLTLTIFLAVYAGLIAVPLGILLALGRQSRLPAVRLISIIFIEFWRGVPIIAVIFLASLLLPLIMPAGADVDRLARAVIGLAFVISAYMAEAVRGGLQALPTGQHEAAKALGLSYWKSTGFIVLPQALRISLPAMTNEFIALFKNTTLVLVVSILDLLGIAQASLADPNWVGMNMEAYAFTGLVYWLICFALSRWSKSLETAGGAPRGH
ncbi:MAG: amino acid ABC transporter permease [Rhizobiales bacterium 65-9]|nr:amino acid ABC transporter permease [Hyphomicrobiales bacterium]OJY36752.1 MAG: amino acid ABC transporter permease [Rhizobiales bacterium 65-9]